MAFEVEPQKIKAWSPSRLGAYEKCARLAKYKFIDKLEEPPSEHLDRGTAVHKSIEGYVKGYPNVTLHPTICMQVRPLIDEVRNLYLQGAAKVEEELAFTKDWKPTGWFAGDAWYRIKMDVCIVRDRKMRIIDWKTGKYSDKKALEYNESLRQYAMAGLTLDRADYVAPELVFTDNLKTWPGPDKAYILEQKDAAGLRAQYEKRALPMLNDTTFAPNPSVDNCKFCPFTRSKGGPCEY
jgi:hypothetical protein